MEEQALEAPAAAQWVGALAAVGASGAAPASPNASREPIKVSPFSLRVLFQIFSIKSSLEIYASNDRGF
jgi:hypothetical protein